MYLKLFGSAEGAAICNWLKMKKRNTLCKIITVVVKNCLLNCLQEKRGSSVSVPASVRPQQAVGQEWSTSGPSLVSEKSSVVGPPAYNTGFSWRAAKISLRRGKVFLAVTNRMKTETACLKKGPSAAAGRPRLFLKTRDGMGRYYTPGQLCLTQ